jgi:hypothetical protein
MLDDVAGDPSDTGGLAGVVAEGKLIEIGPKVLLAHGGGVRAEKPAFQQRDCPVAGLQGIVLAPLRLGLQDHVVEPLVEAARVVTRRPVRDDVGVGDHLPVGEAL